MFENYNIALNISNHRLLKTDVAKKRALVFRLLYVEGV